jgi:hypothetical protein
MLPDPVSGIFSAIPDPFSGALFWLSYPVFGVISLIRLSELPVNRFPVLSVCFV